MSTEHEASPGGMGRTELVEELVQFYKERYNDAVAHLAQGYPRDTRSLHIDWSDLYAFDPGLAEDFREYPRGSSDPHVDPLSELHDALYRFDLPADIDLQSDSHADAHVRVHLPENQQMGLGDLRSEHRGKYVAVRGQIERVTQATERIVVAAWDCNKCGHGPIKIPQPKDDLQEPGSCPGSCSGKPNFLLNEDESDTVDERKLRVSQPPAESDGKGADLTVYLSDDLAFSDGDRSLMGMAGERVTIHGILKRDKSQTRGRNAKPLFDAYIDAHALDFESGVRDDVEIDKHREEIQEHIDSGEAFDRLAASTAPGIQGGQRMADIKKAIVLYLFGASRKELADGAIRGDIHLGLIGDPSTGKSQLQDFVDRVSPRVERLSSTEGSGAGLTATAEQDEFAGGDWVLSPGLLPIASGGHAIIDEVDKMGDEIDSLHEALETQRINVAKAGMRAELKTECGVMVAANPEQGRFDNFAEAVEEIDLPPALFSRFDILHTLKDQQDEDIDGKVAGAVLDRWQAAADDDGDSIPRPVAPETYTAWIALAQDIEPEMPDAVKDRLQEFYVEERSEEWDPDADVIPITARSVPAMARLAEAHASVHLRETMTMQDVEVAINRMRAVMGDVYLDAEGRMDADVITEAAPTSQKERMQRLRDILETADESLTESEFIHRAVDEGIKQSDAENALEKLKQQGVIYTPPGKEGVELT